MKDELTQMRDWCREQERDADDPHLAFEWKQLADELDKRLNDGPHDGEQDALI